MRVHQQACFVLLNRPYSETSWIVEVFSQQHGRLALMAKGARRIKSTLKGVLMPFQPVLLSWTGKGEIPTLTSAEIDQRNFSLIDNELRRDALVCGFYCNELIVNLLHRHDPHPKLYQQYQAAILSLSEAPPGGVNSADWLAQKLREFEQNVIRETGYEVNFENEADGKTPIERHRFYRFQQGQGFVACPSNQPKAVSGAVIQSVLIKPDGIAKAGLSADDLSQGKHLMRDILNQTLGYKKVVSRELFYPKAR